MLFYLLSADELGDLFARLGYDFDEDTIPRAIDYYLDRTSHGSILSRVVHAWVLARSDRSRSWQFVLEALESDVSDTQGGTTSEGIHLGAMAGTLDLLQRCYTGLEVREDACGSKRSCRRGSGASRSASSTADSWSSSSSRARVSRSLADLEGGIDLGRNRSVGNEARGREPARASCSPGAGLMNRGTTNTNTDHPEACPNWRRGRVRTAWWAASCPFAVVSFVSEANSASRDALRSPRIRRAGATTRTAWSAGTRRVSLPTPPAGRAVSGRGRSTRCRAPRRPAAS
jgi:Glycosyl hydrolase family 65 central catalytic domain